MIYLSNCPICNSSSIALYYKARSWDKKLYNVYRCFACSHRFINPQLSWAEESGYYDKDYTAYDADHGMSVTDEDIVRQAKITGKFRHIPIKEGEHILDVGCGGGYFLRIIKKLGLHGEGTELNKIGAEVARQYGLEVFNGTIEQYQAANSSKKFDIITLNHVLEHMQNPVRELSVLHNMILHTGFIYVAVPNSLCYASILLRNYWHSAEVPRHLHQFTGNSLIEAGHRAGLTCKKLFTYTPPQAGSSSLRIFLRNYFLIPQRISKHLRFLDSLNNTMLPWMDAKHKGETLIAFFTGK